MERVVAKVKDNDVEVGIDYNFGENLSEMLELFGEECVYAAAKRQTRIDLQGVMRRLAAAGKTEEEIQAELSEWKPGTKVSVAQDPVAVLMRRLNAGELDEDARQKLREALAM